MKLESISDTKANNKSMLSKLTSETNLLGDIAKSTFESAKLYAESQFGNKEKLAIKAAEGVALGVGLTVVTKNPDCLGLASRALVDYGGYFFGGLGAYDVYSKLKKPIVQTWHGKSVDRTQLNNLGSYFGHGLFNIGLMGSFASVGAYTSSAFLDSKLFGELQSSTSFLKTQAQILDEAKMSIVKLKATGNLSYDDFLAKYPELIKNEDLSGLESSQMPIKLQHIGSGFVLKDGQTMVTNFHCVKDATNFEVMTSEGDSIGAQLVKTDPKNDLALLKLDRENAIGGLDLSSKKLVSGLKVQNVGYLGSESYPVFQSGTILKDVILSDRNPPEVLSFANMKLASRDINFSEYHSSFINQLMRKLGLSNTPLDNMIKLGVSGSPVLQSGKVIGVISQDSTTNPHIFRIIPVQKLTEFLKSE